MNVYIVTDIEGVAGVVFYCHRGQSHLSHEIEMRNRMLLTEEVNAAVRGALGAGAETVVVHDAHGSGYNILPESIHEQAELVHGRLDYRVMLDTLHPGLDESVDALVLVGMHAKAGTFEGAIPHSLVHVETESGQTYALSEAGETAAFAGHFGIPTVFISGDQSVCADTLDLIPNAESVVTKVHYAPQLARTRSPGFVRQQIEWGVTAAIEKKDEIPPFKIDGRCTVRISDRDPEKKYPDKALQCDDYPTALLSTMRRVPWFKPIEGIDDGWRYPDKMEPGNG